MLPNLLIRFDRFTQRLVQWGGHLAGLVILSVACFVFYEVICRYLLNSPTLWVMDFSIYFIMWSVFLGAANTMKTRGHVMVDVLVKKFPENIQNLLEILAHLVVLGFSLALFLTGMRSCINAYRMKELTLSALYIPLYYPMSAIPIGCFLLVLEEIRAVLRKLRPIDLNDNMTTNLNDGRRH